MSGTNRYDCDRITLKHCQTDSAKSTPQKPRSKLMVNSLPSTPTEKYKSRRNYTHSTQIRCQNTDRDADESSLTTTPEKYSNKTVLGEIDEFLSNIKTIKRFSAQRKLEQNFNQTDRKTTIGNSEKIMKQDTEHRKERLELKDVDRLISEMEKQQKMMEGKQNVRTTEGNEKETKTWKPGENKNSVPDYSYGMRDIMYAKEDHKKLSSSIQNYIASKTIEVPFEKKSSSESLDNSSPPTVFERRIENPVQSFINFKGTEMVEHREFQDMQPKYSLTSFAVQNFQNSAVQDISTVNDAIHGDSKKNTNNNSQNNPMRNSNENPLMYKPTSSSSGSKLFNLADLWNTTSGTDEHPYGKNKDRGDNNLLPKLEEERYRRLHCEKIIQELQLKLLEMQQRLAVAIQVDCAKDAAILKFHEAWEKVAEKWQELETERNMLSQQLNSIRGRNDCEVTEAIQKVAHYEEELTKAIEVAHITEEKCRALEYENSSYLSDMQALKNDLDYTHKKVQSYEDERRELINKISDLENYASEDKKMLDEKQKELQQNVTELNSYKTELKTLKEEKSKLENSMEHERSVITRLESQHKMLQGSLENSKRNEKMLQLELKHLQDQTEKTKGELRNYYQQQVEVLVKDKLIEFQTKLDKAEKALHDELQFREQNIASTAAKQLQRLNEKHQVEINLLEEKHKEEISLYVIKTQQLQQKLQDQDVKLEQIQVKRNNIAQELRTVMEAQWFEALKIINDGKTPQSVPPESKQGIFPSKKIQPYLKDYYRFLTLKDEIAHQDIEPEKQTVGYIQSEQQKLCAENFKAMGIINTPLTSRAQTSDQLHKDNELKKYIKMLLDKQPGLPLDKDVKKCLTSQNSSSSDFNDLTTWHQFAQVSVAELQEDRASHNGLHQKDERANKPPWK